MEGHSAIGLMMVDVRSPNKTMTLIDHDDAWQSVRTLVKSALLFSR